MQTGHIHSAINVKCKQNYAYYTQFLVYCHRALHRAKMQVNVTSLRWLCQAYIAATFTGPTNIEMKYVFWIYMRLI